MGVDIRLEAAKYYDSDPDIPNDIPFYLSKLPSTHASILELGCGTGRVTLPLATHCSFIQGIDISPSMLSICREKLTKVNLPAGRVRIDEGDITDFSLSRHFDLIIAPYRVLQNLETNAQVDGLFECIRRHLAPQGQCILNVFRPNRDPQGLKKAWANADEQLEWEIPVDGGKLACYVRRLRMDVEKLILYPQLIYRRYQGDVLQEERIFKFTMRCYYPADFQSLILDHGFKILDQWGGYQGEVYGQGPELVIQFTHNI
jgi:SAM-dependent methyltransferase